MMVLLNMTPCAHAQQGVDCLTALCAPVVSISSFATIDPLHLRHFSWHFRILKLVPPSWCTLIH